MTIENHSLYKFNVYEMLDPSVGFTETIKVVRASDAMKIREVLDRVVESLSGHEWSADKCSELADILRAAGFEIRDV